METQISNPDEDYKISPEALEVAKTYLACHSTKDVAQTLGIAVEQVNYYLRKPDVKRFIDTIFMEQGYMNRGKIQEIMDELFEIKLEEMRDSEMGTSKDILDIITLQHKMRMEEYKAQKETNQVNVKQQINVGQPRNFGDNYDNLLNKLIKA